MKSRRPTHPHFCTRSRKWGSFVIGRKTIKKRMLKQLQAVKMELRRRMHDPIAKTGVWLNQMLKGHLNYYAVSGKTARACGGIFNAVRWRWLKSLRRRSQRAVHELGEIHQLNRPLLPVDQDTTPTTMSPLRRQNPREEPGALAAHAGICAGCALKAHVTQSPGMAAAAKLSQQPRTKSCVVSGNGHCEA